mgnify:CR=1 FL=1
MSAPVWHRSLAARHALAMLACVAGGSILLLAWLEPGWGEAIRRVVIADLVALVALLGGCLAIALRTRPNGP